MLPDSFKPLLTEGDPGAITIPAFAPGLDGKPNPNAPSVGGEIYIKAIVDAQIIIGPVKMIGFISITAAVAPGNGGSVGPRAYLKIDGAVGVDIPLIGSYTGVLNLGLLCRRRRPGWSGGSPSRAPATSSPGVSLDGQFLLEINTFGTTQKIQTFATKTKRSTPSRTTARRASPSRSSTASTTTTPTSSRSSRSTSRRACCSTSPATIEIGRLKIVGNAKIEIGLAPSNPSFSMFVYGTVDLAPLGDVTVGRRLRHQQATGCGPGCTSASPSTCPA